MTATATPTPPESKSAQSPLIQPSPLRDMVTESAQGAEIEGIDYLAMQMTMSDLGKTSADFNAKVAEVRQRIDAAAALQTIDESLDDSKAIEEQRAAIRAECEAKRAELLAELDKVFEPLQEFSHKHPYNHNSRQASQATSIHSDFLRSTADKAIDRKISELKARLRMIGHRCEEIGKLAQSEAAERRKLEEWEATAEDTNRQDMTRNHARNRAADARSTILRIEGERLEGDHLRDESNRLHNEIKSLEASKLDWRNFSLELD